MNITNKHKLPGPLYRAIAGDAQPREGLSVTDLIQPPRMTQLTRRHWDELEEDASERIWSLLGSSVHYILAHAAQDARAEQSLVTEVLGIPVAWHPDMRYDHTIDDYKITSVWNVIFEPKGRVEYHQQLNSYAYLHYVEDGTLIEQLRIWAILRDWQASKLRTEPDYPPIPIVLINIPAWPIEQAKTYLETRVKLHTAAMDLADDSLPLCLPDDMWQKPERWAVMKPGRKAAVRLFDTENAACNLRNQLPGGCYVVRREGTRGRCERFCIVSKWCDQYAEYRKTQGGQ